MGRREGWCGGEGAVGEGGEEVEREVEGGDEVGEGGLERGEEVEVGFVLGFDAGFQVLAEGFDGGYGVFLALCL